MLPTGFIQDLLSRVDVVEVVGRHVELKRGGVNLMGLCPFHGEKSPSFSVSPSKQFYYCFGCGASGDALRFLTEFNGLSFMDAVRELAQQVGLSLPESDATPEQEARANEERARRNTLFTVLEHAASHYSAALKGSPRAVAYLKQRGLTDAVAARFGLGYAPQGWRSLASAFPQYDDPLLVDAGLVIASAEPEQEQKRYDRFRDRIMFPIRSVKGEVIGFGGRVLEQGEPKYLNSPETPVFHKGHELYGLHEARQGLRAKGYALVVEGYMDVVALAQWGYPNAVATLGTACTAQHLAKLFRFTDAVVFSFDGDAAGRRAAGRALEAALPHATDIRSVRFLFLPPEHDPDSFIRDLGPAAFEQALTGAVPLSAQLIHHAAADSDLATAEGRSKMLTQAGPLVEQLPAGLLREQVVQELARQGGVQEEVLRAHWARRQAASGNSSSSQAAAGATAANEPGQAPAARRRPSRGGRGNPQTATRLDRAAWLLARHTDRWTELSSTVQAMLCGSAPPHGPFFRAVERLLHEHGPVTLETLLADLAQDAEAELMASLLADIRASHALDPDPPGVDLATLIGQLEFSELSEQLTVLIQSGDLSDEDRARIRAVYARQAELKLAGATG